LSLTRQLRFVAESESCASSLKRPLRPGCWSGSWASESEPIAPVRRLPLCRHRRVSRTGGEASMMAGKKIKTGLAL
jgi:hypothetical protein